jgi:hypothetical protein
MLCWSTVSRSGEATLAIGTGAFPAQPVGAGAVATRITAVGTDVAFADPSLFVAVTRTRSVLPTSTRRSRYVLAVAELILEHAPPFVSQRSHL